MKLGPKYQCLLKWSFVWDQGKPSYVFLSEIFQLYLNSWMQKKAYFKHKSKSISSIAIYLNDSNISQSEGEELGMWRHIEDAKGGRDCGHNEDPQKQPGKRILYRNNVCNL